MISAEQLEKSLETLEGFKRISKPFLFFFGGPKPSFEIWSKATFKTVVPNYSLAEYTHDDNFYQIMAFSIRGTLSEDVLGSLRKQAADFPLGTVRFESTMHSSADQLVAMMFDDDETRDIISLSDVDAGVFVYPRPTGTQGKEFPLVLYALHEGKHYYLPVEAKFLK